jgi:hypothetical protein
VLDVQTGKQMLFNKDNNAVDNYSYPQPNGALAFLPITKRLFSIPHFNPGTLKNQSCPILNMH